MSLAELIPVVRLLSRDEQVELKRFLESELCDHNVPGSEAATPAQGSELLKQLVVAAPLQRDPVEITPDGLRALEQLLSEAGAKNHT
jgi:hypothetical protein